MGPSSRRAVHWGPVPWVLGGGRGRAPGEAKAGDPPPSHSDGRSPVLWLSSALGIVGGIQAAHMWGAQSQGPQCRLSISRWGGRWCWCFVGSPAAPTPRLCQPSPWALPGTPGSALSSQCPPPAPRPGAVVSHLPNQTPPSKGGSLICLRPPPPPREAGAPKQPTYSAICLALPAPSASWLPAESAGSLLLKHRLS